MKEHYFKCLRRGRGEGVCTKSIFFPIPFPFIPLVYQLSLGRHLFLTLAFLCRKLMMAAKLFIHWVLQIEMIIHTWERETWPVSSLFALSMKLFIITSLKFNKKVRQRILTLRNSQVQDFRGNIMKEKRLCGNLLWYYVCFCLFVGLFKTTFKSRMYTKFLATSQFLFPTHISEMQR